MKENEKIKELLKESEAIIDEVCEKYGYETEDTQTHKSLRTILREIVPNILRDSKEEDRKIFYEMLRKTPIVITENLTQEGLKQLKEKYIGNINPHIKEEKMELGEYGKSVAAGAYVSAPKISEDMKFVEGKKSFLYIQRLDPYNAKAIDFLKTYINVPHLIHELGHAWNAEKEAYKMLEDGTLVERFGTAEFRYCFEKSNDGGIIQKLTSTKGLFLEEGMNTIEEEKVMARYIGISREEMKEKYKEILIPSEYQGFMSEIVEDLIDRTYEDELKQWRLHGDETKVKKVEELMEKTTYWKYREERALQDESDEISFAHKRRSIEKAKNEKIPKFFEEYEEIFFPDVSNMTPIQRIDNVLEQCYTFKGIKYQFDLSDPEQKECYQDIIIQTLKEGYILINQAAEIKKNLENINQMTDIKKVAEEVTVSRVSNVTNETKQGLIQNKRSKEKEEQGVDSKDER